MKRLLTSLTASLLAFPPCALLAASTYGDGFASGKPGDYVEKAEPSAKIQIVTQDGKNALVLTDTQVTLKPEPVTAGQAYALSFEASFSAAGESIEDNPRFDILLQPAEQSPVLPSREIQFLSSEGRAIGKKVISALPFRQTHTYTDHFHAPPGAASMRLLIASGKGVTLQVQNLQLAPHPAAMETLNLNPGFALGPFNYSGWENISAGGKLVPLAGKTIFDTKYGSRGATFPLAGPGTYALSAKATSNGYNSSVNLDILDASGKQLMQSNVRNFTRTNYFVVPPGATSGALLVYCCLLEEVRVTRVGDEKAIDDFRDKNGR